MPRQHVRRSNDNSDPLLPKDRHQLPTRLSCCSRLFCERGWRLLASPLNAGWLRLGSDRPPGYGKGQTKHKTTEGCMASAPATDIFLRPVSQLSRRYPGLSAEGNTDRPWCDLTHVHSRVPCSAFLIRPTQLDCSAYVVICACICCCWCAYSPCPDLASTVVAVWRAAPLLPSVTRVVRSSVRLTCAFSRSSSRGPLSSPPAVAAAACLVAAVAAADDDDCCCRCCR